MALRGFLWWFHSEGAKLKSDGGEAELYMPGGSSCGANLSWSKTQEEKPQTQGTSGLLGTRRTDLGEPQLQTAHMPWSPPPAPPAFRFDPAAGSRGGSAQTPASPGCSLPNARCWVTKSPEGISTVLNSLCLYLYTNDRTLRCKFNRNLVSKSRHFLMGTSIKAPERPHAAIPQEQFQKPTCKPRAHCVLEILSHSSIYGQGFFPPGSCTTWCYLPLSSPPLPMRTGLCKYGGPQGCRCFLSVWFIRLQRGTQFPLSKILPPLKCDSICLTFLLLPLSPPPSVFLLATLPSNNWLWSLKLSSCRYKKPPY